MPNGMGEGNPTMGMGGGEAPGGVEGKPRWAMVLGPPTPAAGSNGVFLLSCFFAVLAFESPDFLFRFFFPSCPYDRSIVARVVLFCLRQTA